MKQRKTGTGGRKLYERQEDHSGMETYISETGNIGTKGETRGTGTKWRGVRGVMEIGMDFGVEGIAEDDGAGRTCQRSIVIGI